MDDMPPRMRDRYRYNDTSNALELATADRRFEQLIERKERLIERSRFGVLALNGASTIGVLSNLDDLQSVVAVDIRAPLGFFIVGMILGLISVQADTIHAGSRAAQMFGHLSLLRSMRATLDDHLTADNEKKFKAHLGDMQERLQRMDATKLSLDSEAPQGPTDFAYSPVALLTLNLAGGAWVGGVLTLLLSTFY